MEIGPYRKPCDSVPGLRNTVPSTALATWRTAFIYGFWASISGFLRRVNPLSILGPLVLEPKDPFSDGEPQSDPFFGPFGGAEPSPWLSPRPFGAALYRTGSL